MSTQGWIAFAVLFPVVVALLKKSWREKCGERLANWPPKMLFIAGALTLVNFFMLCNEVSVDRANLIVNSMGFVIYITIPALLFILASTLKWRSGIFDLAIVAWIWLPCQLRWVYQCWGSEGGETSYVLHNFCATILILTGLFALRGKELRMDWRFGWQDAAWIGGALLVLIPAIVFPGLLTHFVKLNVAKDWEKFPLAFLEIWFVTALFEELLFRGIMQETMTKWLNPWLAIPITSFVFGLTHIGNTAGGGGFPNWWYVLFASIAGLAYGVVYYKRSLQASITLHCLVDFIWWLFLKAHHH